MGIGYRKVLSQVGSEVVDQLDERTGVAPAQVIADGEALDTKMAGFTGSLSVMTADDSGIATCYVTAGVQVIGSVTGGAGLSDTKGTGSKINVYVEGGTIQIENQTGADISVEARLH